MMTIAAILLAVTCAAQDNMAPAPPPAQPATITQLKETFMSALEDAERLDALQRISQTAPRSGQDVSALFDLFSRFSDPELRRGVMDSLALMPQDSPSLEPLFATYLQQPEPEAEIFGINGALRLRARSCLPLIRKIADRKMPASDVSGVLSERNSWWVQYEALSALAQWEGDQDLPLILSKSKKSPSVARLLGQYFWKQSFDNIRDWASSSSPDDRTRAIKASGAPISPDDARATRDGMLALMRDPKADWEVRHLIALKVGACSSSSEVDNLISEHDGKPEGKERLLWAAAVFASQSEKAIPLLVRYARQTADEAVATGAKQQLVIMVGDKKAAELIDQNPK